MQSLVTFASYGMEGTLSWRFFFYDNNRSFFFSMFEIFSEGKGERILDLLSDTVECVLQQSVIKGLQEVVPNQTPWTLLIGLSIPWLWFQFELHLLLSPPENSMGGKVMCKSCEKFAFLAVIWNRDITWVSWKLESTCRWIASWKRLIWLIYL